MIPSPTREHLLSMATPNQRVVVVRLEERQLAELEKKLSPMFITTTTSELLAGQMIGEQRVLKMLRDGFTISA